MPKRYQFLLDKLKERGMTRGDFAKRLGMSASAFSERLSGRTPFTHAEMYRIMDELELDYTLMYLVFPRGAVA